MEKKEYNLMSLLIAIFVYGSVLSFVTVTLYKTNIKIYNCDLAQKINNQNCYFASEANHGFPFQFITSQYGTRLPTLTKGLGKIKSISYQYLILDIIFWSIISLGIIKTTEYLITKRKK